MVNLIRLLGFTIGEHKAKTQFFSHWLGWAVARKEHPIRCQCHTHLMIVIYSVSRKNGNEFHRFSL